MLKYPKIETLYKRDETTFKVTPEFRLPEFANVKRWHVTEKIHGTNIRIHYDRETNNVFIAGRTTTDLKDLPAQLILDIINNIKAERLESCLLPRNKSITLFGEGCGAGINKGGAYHKDKVFVLFDILIDDTWWMPPFTMMDMANKIGIETAPVLDIYSVEEITEATQLGFYSKLAKIHTGQDVLAEGVVAIAQGLYLWNGDRVMFKLKTKDFATHVYESSMYAKI